MSAMTPTAEEILNKHTKRVTDFDNFYEAISRFENRGNIPEVVLAAMEEYASMAFDAGCAHGFDPERHYSTDQAKEEFMKKLFNG